MAVKLDANMRRLLDGAWDKVIREWSRPAFEKLGSRLQQALLCEAVLQVASTQFDDVPAELVRRIVIDGHAWAIEKAGY